jgi:hypothetical protein
MLITIIVIVFAVAGALTYNRLVWRPRQAVGRTPPEGLGMPELAAPLGTGECKQSLFS